MSIAGICFNEAHGKILLLSQPMSDRPAVDSQQLRKLLIESGFGDCLIDDLALTNCASRCNVQTEPFGLEIARRVDATLAIHIDLGDMAATLSLTPAHGGKPITVPEVMAALAQAGVSFGIEEVAVAQARLHAGGAITARFAQAVQMTAGTMIAIGDMARDA